MKLWLLMKFSSPYGNVIPGLERNRDEENSSWVTNGTFPLPHSWLSSCDDIKIPHWRLHRSWGIFILSQLLSHDWGSGNVPWVTNEEFYPSLFLSRPGITFPHWRGTLHTVSALFEPHSWLQPHPMKMLIEPQSKTNIETIEPHLELNPTHK